MIKKKNLLIITGIFPPDIGGPATFTESLLKYLTYKNYCVKIISLSNIKKRTEKKNNLILIKRNQSKLIRTLLLIFYIKSSIKSFKNIISCGLIFESYLATIGEKLDKKIFRFVGDSIWEKYISKSNKREFNSTNNSLKINLLVKYRNFLLRTFDQIVTPSYFLKDYLIKKIYISDKKIKVISNFVSDNQNLKLSYPKKKKYIYLVSISRLVAWKNLDYLIKAVKNFNFIYLDIVGEGPEKKKLADLIISENAKNISLIGKKDKLSTLNILNKSDCFIQLSSYEGMSFSILEAIKLNKPMILSNIKPNIETGKSAAIYVNYKSEEQINNALKLIYDLQIRKQLSNEAKFLSKYVYDSEISLREYENLLV